MENIKKIEKFLVSKYGYKKYRKKIISKKKNIELYFDRGLNIYAIRRLNSSDGWKMIAGPLENILETLNFPDDIEMVKIVRRAK